MKRSLLYLLMALPCLCAAQSNFQNGYLVKNSGDTLRGLIDYKEILLNPVSVIFKDTKESSPQEFLIKDVEAYTIDNQVSYKRFLVDLTMSQIELRRLHIGVDKSTKKDSLWLQVLQEGKNVTLYYYRDSLKPRFYLKENDAQVPVELVVQMYLNPKANTVVLTDNRYVNQLTNALEKYRPEFKIKENQVSGLRYNKKELLDFVSIINDQKVEKPKLPSSRFFIGAGLIASQSSLYYPEFFGPTTSKSDYNYAPILSIGIDYFTNPAIGKLVFRGELSISKGKYTHEGSIFYQETISSSYSYDQLYAAFTPQVLYNFYNTSAFKIFLGAGLGFNFSKTNDEPFYRSRSESHFNEVINNPIHFSDFKLNWQFTAGMVINKRFEISAKIYPFISTIDSEAIDIKRAGVGLNYFFGKH
jgi:hypothetical protein